MPVAFEGFPRETRSFFRELKRNNNREWFLAHKVIYEQKAKKPMVEFVLALKAEFANFACEMLADPAVCIFRIYRDVRFSQDKSPYKTHIAAHFDPKELRKRPSAGLYFHLDPDQIFLGGGVYMPESAELLAIRNYIAKHHEKLRKIISASEFKKLFGEMKGEQLSRLPKGFHPDHPAADLLRYKQFLAFVTLRPEIAETPKLLREVVRYFKAMMPLVRFLNAPLKKAPPKLR